MKYLYLLFLVGLSQGFVVEKARVKRGSELNIPSFESLTALDPAAVEVRWTAVKSDDAKDPVLGYKLKKWELPNVKSIKYEIINGVQTLVEEEHAPKFTDEVPQGKPEEFITKDTKYHLNNLKYDVFYEFRVQAYSKGRESPLSAPTRIKLHKDENSKDLYETI